jgi:predicted 3-demethylubiquinone-9 3-methyltransferase (glyoxalase superfamily)
MQNISTCLWFDDQAEPAVNYYIGIFPNSRILEIKYCTEGMPGPDGSVLTIRFTLDGTEYVALNGGPHFKFSPAISLVAYCDTQAEVDRLWSRLTAGGQESQCGWLADKFGVSWQIVPRPLLELLNTPDKAASGRAVAAMMKMRKLDIAALQRAYKGTQGTT